MKYIGAFLIFAILVNADPGKIFLTQVCHSGRRSLRLWRLALLNISDEDCEILATTANLQVHEMLRTTSNLTAGQMSQLRRIHDLFFEGMSGRCQAWLGGFQLRSGECLALHILIGGQDMLGLNRSQWRQDDDSDYDSSYNVEVFPGKFMKWYPTQHLRSVVRSSRKWHFESHKELQCQLWTSPGRSHRPRRKVSASVPANQSYERFNPAVPGIPLKMLPSKHPLTTSWFRKEPTALSCNSSNYDWRWSHLRRELWSFHRKENLRTLPLVPIELLEFIAPLYDPQGMARFNLEETTNVAGEGLSLDTEREFTGIFTDICVLGQVSVMFLAVLAHYQVGQPSLHLLKYLYISVFLKGLWVLLDGSLWPITAVDVVKLHEQHRTEEPKPSWRLCPCGRISSPQVPTQPKKHVQNVALIGGHNYAFDIALGLHDASVALSSPLTMNLLGYAFAEKYAAAAEYCQLMEGNFCVRDVEMQNLLKQLSDSNCGLQNHCANLVKSLSVAQGTNHTWVNNPTFDLATAREETRRVYLQSTYLQRADFIICTHPYLLAYLLDEVPERRQPVFLFWQGGSLLEYLHQDLHAWVQTKLVAWRTRTLFVMNSLDHYWLKRTVGHATFLPFGARHFPKVLQKQLGQIYSVRKSKQILLHRMQFILQKSELARLLPLIAHHFAHGQKMTGHDLRFFSNPFDVWQLLNFEAIVLFPWNLEITTFLEFTASTFLFLCPIPLSCRLWCGVTWPTLSCSTHTALRPSGKNGGKEHLVICNPHRKSVLPGRLRRG